MPSPLEVFCGGGGVLAGGANATALQLLFGDGGGGSVTHCGAAVVGVLPALGLLLMALLGEMAFVRRSSSAEPTTGPGVSRSININSTTNSASLPRSGCGGGGGGGVAADGAANSDDDERDDRRIRQRRRRRQRGRGRMLPPGCCCSSDIRHAVSRRAARSWRAGLRGVQLAIAWSLALASATALVAHMVLPAESASASARAIADVAAVDWLTDLAGLVAWTLLALATAYRRRWRFGHLYAAQRSDSRATTKHRQTRRGELRPACLLPAPLSVQIACVLVAASLWVATYSAFDSGTSADWSLFDAVRVAISASLATTLPFSCCGLSLLGWRSIRRLLKPAAAAQPNLHADSSTENSTQSSSSGGSSSESDHSPVSAASSTPTRNARRRRAQEDKAGFWSLLYLSWSWPVIAHGFRHVLQLGDLFILPRDLGTSRIARNFIGTLTGATAPQAATTSSSSSEPLKQRVPLLSALNSQFGAAYYPLGLLRFFADTIAFSGPMLLNALVSFVSDADEPMWHGYLYALGLFGGTLVSAILNTQYNYLVARVGMQVRAALVTSVYSKTLRLGGSSTHSFTTGQITNFMSTDTDRVVNFCPSFHKCWSLPVQVGLTLYLLYVQIGFAFLAGLGVALLLIPINRYLAIRIGVLSKEMMVYKDARVKLTNETLAGIRVIKLYAWEDALIAKIQGMRALELVALRGRKYLDAWCVYFWATTPVLISILTFVSYVYWYGPADLTAARVFTSLALFNLLITPLNAFPWVLNGVMDAWVSLKRLEAFFDKAESCRPDDRRSSALSYYYLPTVSSTPSTSSTATAFTTTTTSTSTTTAGVNEFGQPAAAVEFRNATLSWLEPNTVTPSLDHAPFTLANVSLTIPKGALVGVFGPFASGKSSLLASMLGEMSVTSGSLIIHDRAAARSLENSHPLSDTVNPPPPCIAYATQQPWVQNATVRDNILFGLPLRQPAYSRVLFACALEPDMAILRDGDLTEVGEQGVTLSGGQKARVALARAVYRASFSVEEGGADLVLLDDPLSAVDAHVAAHLMQHCIGGLLKGRTVVLVTHHVQHLVGACNVLVRLTSTREVASAHKGTAEWDALVPDLGSFQQSADVALSLTEHDPPRNEHKARAKAQSILVPVSDSPAPDSTPQALMTIEEREVGVVKAQVHASYWRSMGMFLTVSIFVTLSLMQASRNINDWWLSYWVGTITPNVTLSDQTYYLEIYGGLAAANSAFTLARAFAFAYGGLCAARNIHTKLLNRILRAPVSFFDTTPLGRILNRFSSDVNTIDDSLPFIMNILLAQVFGIAGSIAVTCYGLPWFALALLPLGGVYYLIQRYYRRSSREVKRLDTISLSPIYAHFSETIHGVSCIRAFAQENRFCDENMTKLTANQCASYAGNATGQWLGARLQLLGVFVLLAVVSIALVQHALSNSTTGSVDPGLVGLSISYALSVTSQLAGVVTSFTETEKEMVSVERACQYIENTPEEEPDVTLPPTAVPATWPATGAVSFQNVTVVYRPGLAPALDGLSLQIAAGEKIGVVGRTGSGKSTLLLALFRMVGQQSGRIVVDGVDTATITRKHLRSSLTIIPQDPVLFSGSLRENLDPFSRYSDAQVWDALLKCRLVASSAQPTTLDVQRVTLSRPVHERGSNFSVGERQLICLGRALLKQAKILCIDEATASVDADTDAQIQHTLRTEFPNTTVITIAHRIGTILDYDRIVVLDSGRVLETGPPRTLLTQPSSHFAQLANRVG
ncbi:multidrug resistance-associated protein 7 [Capsaspora owczarzaki ATCC 30864]|uniref:ABC-type xenobiotic transporter n=1 Tax=Capsaspora owczarzaki (strain ATCC 30864) TaxID=595528 RepID=A0A0D2WSN5_CAPO3|nr:multidrug resistance-associated protein 7 [Capsaspora owczarzaki ATCC 30864]